MTLLWPRRGDFSASDLSALKKIPVTSALACTDLEDTISASYLQQIGVLYDKTWNCFKVSRHGWSSLIIVHGNVNMLARVRCPRNPQIIHCAFLAKRGVVCFRRIVSLLPASHSLEMFILFVCLLPNPSLSRQTAAVQTAPPDLAARSVSMSPKRLLHPQNSEPLKLFRTLHLFHT